ncbi:MAG: helicase-related protein [Candidatus Parcubacteria bacterium]|nr:helicase-related protein [Candidatus Parcubacteria bacterium]
MNCQDKKILIVSLSPYFLEKNNFWFEENLEKILEARKTRNFFEDNIILLEKGQIYQFSEFLRKLDEMGYEKVQTVSEPGEFSRKGGIIEIFPLNMNYAIRLDFFGNLIDNIEKLPVEIKNEDEEKEIKDRIIKKLKRQKIFSQLGSLKAGDYVVHLDHGVGIYKEKQKISGGEYYILDYASGDKLYVPLGLERKLSRYLGFTDPKISRLGSSLWIKTKKKVKEEIEKLARELLTLYAEREIAVRPPYLAGDEIQRSFDESFAFEETPDQAEAIKDIYEDLEKDKPMDRIVCGDVGFGKTEVALRAAFKVIRSGKQVAILCPTTILANQHFQNFRKRLNDFPVNAALLSRLQSKKEQKNIIRNLKEGKTDFVIGTHRLLSQDVEFKDLGLLIIDDEQRFGVRQKEKLKKMRATLDVLSLSATPIPRTLYMALSSLKGISLIQTPPAARLSIKTHISPWNERTIKNAIKNEIKRRGQVYYLHNRVGTIDSARKFLEDLIPDIRTGIVHGRMTEFQMIKSMDDFQNKKIDVLMATTIIESGLDLPNVNTLIVADAAKLGLSQAYQIRGRVGRSNIQAFAYFFYGENLNEKARLRLDALKKAEELGSGYKVALKDLEIRGAGNILGKEQSGSVNQVGLNLYCQMLSESIEKLREK